MPGASPKQRTLLLLILAFATVYIVWGSTFFFIQVAVRQMPPMILGTLRFLAAGVLMLAWCLLRGEKVWDRQQIKTSVITGLLMLAGGTGSVIWAEKWLPSSLVGILVTSDPFWFVIMDFRMLKENLASKSIMAGLVFGFIGVLMMFGEKIGDAFLLSGNMEEIIALAILLFGTLCWTGGSLYAKYNATGSAVVTSGWQMLSAGIAFLIGSLFLDEWNGFDVMSVSRGAWLSLLYLIVFGSLVAFSAYIWLLKVRSAAQVSTYAYVNPLVAVLMGVVFAGEHLSLLQIGGLAVILAGVLLINLAKYRKERSRDSRIPAH